MVTPPPTPAFCQSTRLTAQKLKSGVGLCRTVSQRLSFRPRFGRQKMSAEMSAPVVKTSSVPKEAQLSLYPPIQPYHTGFLKVSDLHTVYYEISGNADGLPVCFVHGGPGGGTVEAHRRFFDPERTFSGSSSDC